MNRKKLVSIMLATALTFTSTTSTFAVALTKTQTPVTGIGATKITAEAAIAKNIEEEKSAKISKEKAKEIAKEIIKTYFNTVIDESKFTQTSNFNGSDYNGQQNSTWNINWQMNNMAKNISISVTLNAETGEVTQANNYERKVNEENTVPTITVKQAEKASNDFVEKIQPEKYKVINKRDYNNIGNYGSASYSFTYVNKVNGIEFDDNNINIEVDGASGKVVSYYSNWNSSLKFPEVKGVIDQKTAAEAFKTGAKMTLKYMGFTQNYKYYENKRDIKVVYVPEFGDGNLLDAKDGKFLDPVNNVSRPVVKDLSDKEKGEFYSKIKVVTPREKAVEEKEAGTIIKSFINKLYGEGYVIQGLGYQEYAENIGSSSNKTWNASFNKGDDTKYNEGGNISIDALTGEVVSCYKYSNEDYNGTGKFVAKLSWEQAYAKAIEAVSKYYNGKAKQIKTEQIHYNYCDYNNMGERNYYFNFARLENGIEYTDNNINVGFSAVTGEINSLNCNWDKDIKFPDFKNAISVKNASEIMFSKYKPILTYTQINKSNNPQKPDLEMKLAYKLGDASGMYDYTNVDALTGKFLNYNGENIDQNIELFKEKIKNSEAEKELSILASKGLIETADFKLDKKVTQIDLIKMLVNARGYTPYMADKTAELKFSNIAKSDANYKFLQMAVSYGIMENTGGEFIGDKLVTREELAKILVKYSNYDKLAQHSELFKINYEDASKITKENLGYVAIAVAFGFIKIENNQFNPKDNTTMEQLAVGVYNALNNVRNTQ